MAGDPACRPHSPTIPTSSPAFAGQEVRKRVVDYACLRGHVAHTVLARTAGRPDNETARKRNDMALSPSAPVSRADAPAEPTARPRSAAPSVDVSSTEVLITEQEVLFGTAVAVSVPRRKVSRRIAALMGSMVAISDRRSRPPRRDYPKRYEFLERAAMAREMGRL